MRRSSANPWRAEKVYRSRAVIAPHVEMVEQALAGHEVHVCGSWRRGSGDDRRLAIRVAAAMANANLAATLARVSA